MILPALVMLFRPLGLDGTQSFLLAVLLMVIFWWVVNLMPKWISSALLLLVFSFWGRTPLRSVFQFPLSDNFVVILFAFLFSQGIANSGLTKRLLQPLFYQWIRNPAQFLLFVAVCNIALIFVIPQPFARVILFAFIVNEFLEDVCKEKTTREILMFGTFLFSCTSNMLFLRGDIIMNNAVQSFGEVAFTEGSWAAAMTVPTLILMAVEYILLYTVYYRHLKGVRFVMPPAPPQQKKLTTRERGILGLILLTMLLMSLEPLHGISSKWVILASTVVMFLIRLLHLEDIRSINFNLLVWLAAAFSIGSVMRGSGTADIVFSRLSALFPSRFSLAYILVIIVITMVLHMLLGGSVTTTSVVVPGILGIAAGEAPAAMLVLIIYILVYNHFLLPLHHAVLVIGNGDKHFPARLVVQFGGVLSIVMPLFVLFVYRFWWQLIGFFA